MVTITIQETNIIIRNIRRYKTTPGNNCFIINVDGIRFKFDTEAECQTVYDALETAISNES